MKQFNINLDIKKSVYNTDIVCVQNDNNTNIFVINLYDGLEEYSIPDGYTVELAILKADNHFVVIPASVMGNILTVTLTEQALAFPGQARAEVRVLQDSNLMTSTQFLFLVRENIVNDNHIASTTEYVALQSLITEAQTVTAELTEARNALGNVDAIQAELQGASEAITQLIGDLNTKQTEVQELANTLTTKADTAQGVITSLDTMQPQITELQGLITQAQTLNTALNSLTATVNSANAVDGEIKASMQVVNGWIANPEQFKGDKGEPATVTNTSVDGQGNTNITFNDGTIVTVQKGADGTMTFADLTQEQKDSLKGHSGETGEPGEPASNLVTSVNGQIGEVIVTDTTYSAGTNVTIDADNKINAKDTTYTAGTNVTINANIISATDTTYGLASAYANGLMPSDMFSKLNGLYNVVYLTESAYAALGTKDPNTLYIRPKA